MNLKVYNRENFGSVNLAADPRIYFQHNGPIRISIKAASILNLKPGDKVEVCQDADRPKDWYIFKTKNAAGFNLGNDGQKGALKFFCKRLVIDFLTSINAEKSSSFRIANVPIDHEGIKIYAILKSTMK